MTEQSYQSKTEPVTRVLSVSPEHLIIYVWSSNYILLNIVEKKLNYNLCAIAVMEYRIYVPSTKVCADTSVHHV